jgi:hypothetical protein
MKNYDMLELFSFQSRSLLGETSSNLEFSAFSSCLRQDLEGLNINTSLKPSGITECGRVKQI